MADEICKKFDNTVLCETEAQLLNTFLHLIEDADILSGWNLKVLIFPLYIVNRTEMVLSKDDVRRFSLWDLYPVKECLQSLVMNSKHLIFGLAHLDYLELYRKYTYLRNAPTDLMQLVNMKLVKRKFHEGTLDPVVQRRL